MKDGLNAAAIDRITRGLSAVLPSFSSKVFTNEALKPIEQLELKERVTHLVGVLANHLPESYPEAADILIALKPHWDPGDPDDNLRGFAAWPILDYSATYGLEHPEKALDLFEELTPLFSAEFAIRPFYQRYFEMTYERAMSWCNHSDHHVRRLASEGIRPLLPWGLRLKSLVDNPQPLFPLLNKLKDDESEYVRRSVANTLNDVAKHHPDAVVNICRDWQKGASKEREWVIRHATRTLVKAGHPSVFGLLGFTDNPKVELVNLKLDKSKAGLGESITATFQLKSKATIPQTFVLDYAIHYVKANGKTSPKVFKFTQAKLDPDQTADFSKSHSLKDVTTRRHYPGLHRFEILLNGRSISGADFELLT